MSTVLARQTTDSERREHAKTHRALAVEIEHLLGQAEGFVRGGDYLGAHERARYAELRVEQIAASLPAGDLGVSALRGYLELRLHHYDALVSEWQMEVETRHAAYVARERRAIGADAPPR
jgi:hypothetical protein